MGWQSRRADLPATYSTQSQLIFYICKDQTNQFISYGKSTEATCFRGRKGSRPWPAFYHVCKDGKQCAVRAKVAIHLALRNVDPLPVIPQAKDPAVDSGPVAEPGTRSVPISQQRNPVFFFHDRPGQFRERPRSL